MNAVLHPAQRAPSCGFDIPPQPEEVECVEFDPYAGTAGVVFTPGCIPSITLDYQAGSNPEVKTCDQFIALPDGWQLASMTSTGTVTDPSLTTIIGDYGSVWGKDCILGSNPTPGGSPQFVGYTLSGASCGNSVTVTEGLSGTGKVCYRVSCSATEDAALIIRYPQIDETCNANNYGYYCDPTTKSSYYTSELAPSPDTIYINLASGSPLSVPLRFPLYDRMNLMVLIDTYNLVSTADQKDARSIAMSIPYIYTFGSYKARNIGFGYIKDTTDAGIFAVAQSLTWSRTTMESTTNVWDTNVYVGTATATTPPDGPVGKSLNAALKASLGYFDDALKQIWVVTNSYPRDAEFQALQATMSNTGAGAGVMVVFVTPSATIESAIKNLITKYSLPRVAVVKTAIPLVWNAKPNVKDANALAFIEPIFTASRALVGKINIVELNDVYNFVTPPTTTTIGSNPDFATQPTQEKPDFGYYSSNPAVFTLPPNWVNTASKTLMPLTISFKVIETGHTFNTLVSWNEPPQLPSTGTPLTFNYKDTDGDVFIANIVNSIRSNLDPNRNLIDIMYLTQTFTGGVNWVRSMSVYQGADDGAPFALNTWFNSVGLRIVPLGTVSGEMTLTYKLTDGCLESPVGTIIVKYTLSNTPPLAQPVVITVNAGSTGTFNLADYISDAQELDSQLRISILNTQTGYGSLQYNSGGTYTALPTGAYNGVYDTASPSYQQLQFTALSTPQAGYAVYYYRVYDVSANSYAESTITVYINRPPVLRISTTSLSTTPGTTGTWTVTVEDENTDIEDIILDGKSLQMDSYITSLLSGSINLETAAIGTLLVTDTSLTSYPSPSTQGYATFGQSWVPASSYPIGATSTVTYQARDALGLLSNKVTITLTVPNARPTWDTVVANPAGTSNTWPQTTPPITFTISGSDPNQVHTDSLSFTISQLPTSGTLYIVSKTGVETLVVAGTAYPASTYDSGVIDGKTTYTVKYYPSSSVATSLVAISDVFKGYFTDALGLQSSIGSVPINFSVVPKPPTTIDVSATAYQNIPVPLLVTGSDPENNISYLEILSVVYTSPLNEIRFGGSSYATSTKITVGQKIPLVNGQPAWNFWYQTPLYTSFTDYFTYKVVDATNLSSNIGTGTINVQAVNQPPVVTGATYTVNEGATLTIPYTWTTGTSTGPTYSDPDGTQGATTLTATSLPNLGSLSTSSGSPVVLGQPSAKLSSPSGTPSFTYTAPSELATQTTTSYTFTATDGSKTSAPATITIIVVPVDDPPVITITPAIQVATGTAPTKTYTITVTDVDSPTATVYFTDNSIIWPTAAASPSTINTVFIDGPGALTDYTYKGNTAAGSVQGATLFTLTKQADGTFPTFTLTWDPNGANAFSADKIGTFSFQAKNALSSNVATATMQYLYAPPANVAPTSGDILIVVKEDSCAYPATCSPSNWAAVSATDGNTNTPQGEILTLKLLTSAGYLNPGSLINSVPAMQAVPSSLSTGLMTNTAAPATWSFSYNPLPNQNSGNNCLCNPGDSFATCMAAGCTAYAVIPFTITDSRSLTTSTYYIRVVVVPQADAPVSQDTTVTVTTPGTPVPFTIPGTDVDGDLTCIVFDDISGLSPGSDILYMGSTVVIAGMTYCYSPASSQEFPFTFVTTETTATTDTATYHVVDSQGNPSPPYTFTAEIPRTNVPPTATGYTYTSPEDTAVTIPFVYGGTNSPAYSDPDGTPSQTYIQITSLPPGGTLYNNGVPVTSADLNTPIYGNPVFTFQPNPDYTGTTSFNFISCDVDPAKLCSPPATVTVNVTPVNDPPVITMTPLTQTVDRTTPATFQVTVSDVDSKDIAVLLDFNSVPTSSDGVAVNDWGTFTYTVGGVTTTVPATTGFLTSLSYPGTTFGTDLTFTLTWTPSTTIPDGTTGEFTLSAANSVDSPPTATSTWTALSAESVTGTVAVTPNLPPVVVEDPLYPYSYSVTQTEWDVSTGHTFRIVGTDPNTWHADTLTFVITEIPANMLIFDKTTGLPISVNDILGAAPGDVTTDGKTWADIEIRPDPAFAGFMGANYIEFYTVDAAGARSTTQRIPINVYDGNQPPMTFDTILVVFEDTCVFASCDPRASLSTYNDLLNVKHTTLTGLDPNNDPLWLQFESVPSRTTEGDIAWYPSGPTSTLSSITYMGPYPKTTDPWHVWFQPITNQNSPVVDPTTPYAFQQATGEPHYGVYATATYKVYEVDPSPTTSTYQDQTSATVACNVDVTGDGVSDGVVTCLENCPPNAVVGASELWECFLPADTVGHVSGLGTLRIYVIPRPDPPTSEDLVYTIDEDYCLTNPPLEILIPAADPDSLDTEIGVITRGIRDGSKGDWFVHQVTDTSALVNVPASTELIVDPPLVRRVFYCPPPGGYSQPGVALSTLYFKVKDNTDLVSELTYNVRIFVNPVPDQPVWVADRETTMLEDSNALIVLNGRDTLWSSEDSGTGMIVITSVGKGTFSMCNVDGCVPVVVEPGVPFNLTEGRLTYRPLPDENGANYTSFEFDLYVFPGDNVPGATIPPGTIPLHVVYNINVLPVNDPPVLVPRWNPATGPLVNEFDEDTYLRIEFVGTDIDTPEDELYAEALQILDPFQASMYTCAGHPDPLDNCKTDATLVPGIGLVEKFGPAHWVVSFVSYPNWNGNLQMQFIVWDGQLSSLPRTCIIHVRPINDDPSVVKGATAITVEYYNVDVDTTGAEPVETYTLVAYTGENSPFVIYDDDAVEGRELEGTVIEESKGTPNPVVPENPDPSKPLVDVHRLRTKVQDIDFFFQYSLKLDTTLIHANFIPSLVRQDAPCNFPYDFSMSCEAEITALNAFLSIDGLPIRIDEGAESGIGLFLLNDTGNVDKLDRPAAAGFTIAFYRSEQDEALGAPIAAVVILPVIAAATAAAIAAAWILLGQRAQAYAGASFDAFAVVSNTGGTKSPLYDDLGKDVTSPIYAGKQ